MADILKFTETPLIDENIGEYEYHDYDTITGINLNNVSDIRINIQSQKIRVHTS